MVVSFAQHWCLAALGILPNIWVAGSSSRHSTGPEAIELTHGDGVDVGVNKGSLLVTVVAGEVGHKGASGCLGDFLEPGHLSPTGPWDRINPPVVTEISRKQTEQSAFAATLFCHGIIIIHFTFHFSFYIFHL